MIILVRHGEATHHTQHLTGGWTDSELTDKGRAYVRHTLNPGVSIGSHTHEKEMEP